MIATELHESVMEAMDDGRAFERELLVAAPDRPLRQRRGGRGRVRVPVRDEAGFLTGANISIDGGYSRV